MPVRSVSKRALPALVLGTLVCSSMTPGTAHAQLSTYCVNCGDKITQLMQYGKEAATALSEAQIQANSAAMLINQARNMVNFPSFISANIAGDISNVESLMQRGNQLAINAGAVSSSLSNYSSYLGTPPDYAQKYQAWSQQANDAVTATLSSMGLQQNQMSSDQAVLAAIQARAASSGGTVQAIQALTEMTGQVVAEMEKLRQLIMADAQQNANGLRLATDRQATGDADFERFMSTAAPPTSGNPGY